MKTCSFAHVGNVVAFIHKPTQSWEQTIDNEKCILGSVTCMVGMAEIRGADV
ncbi:hypothetical protein EGR_10552 [Echinococcus granulosus]|uniref:Uncharacterized protein n=1 Tax=Echinococcus granulosus TaxID=6210 RepID=W6U0N0_ECHGR|nr:hypothetical protein EGR_10552 [Echinococcus granulosus]EUB54583.1 hypothetical protein EGR_10552 [Echinococcus granulosus]